jgi:hypothetical protein
MTKNFCYADDDKIWNMDEIVKIGLEHSVTVKSARENLTKIEIDLKTDTVFGGMTLNLDNTFVKTWQYPLKQYYANTQIIEKRSLSPRLSIPFYELFSLDIAYEYNQNENRSLGSNDLSDTGNEKHWKNYKSIQFNCTPLVYLKTITKHQQNLRAYNAEQLKFLQTLLRAELDIRQKYIDLISIVDAKKIAERFLNNSRELYQLIWERYNLSLETQSNLDNAFIDKKNAEEQFMISIKNEYSAQVNLTRICEQDMSQAKLEPLPDFNEKLLDESSLLEEFLNNNLDLKITRLQLETAEDILKKSRMTYLPDVKLGAGMEYPDDNSIDRNYSIGVGLSWQIGYQKVANTEKAKIAVMQSKRDYDNLKDNLKDSLKMLVYDFNIRRQSLDIQSKLLENQQRILEVKQWEFNTGKLLAVELEKYKIQVTEAANHLENVKNDIWSIWYKLQMASVGFL